MDNLHFVCWAAESKWARALRGLAAARELGAHRVFVHLFRGHYTRKPPSQTWKAFLNNHVQGLASVDFFTVPTTVGFRVLFGFVVLLQHRWRVVHFNVTEHPTAAWTAQQILEAFPE